MAARVKAIPEGAPVVTPRLFCHDPVAEIEFCTTALGAVLGVRRLGADGRVAHAVVLFGSAMVMIESEWPQLTNRAPAHDGSTPVAIYLYVEDVDRIVDRAAAAGARVLNPPTDQFWGDRTAWILDPAGHVWTLATRIEETTEEERHARLARIHRAATTGGA
jgi:PhnB protein